MASIKIRKRYKDIYNNMKKYLIENANITLVEEDNTVLDNPFFLNKSNINKDDMFAGDDKITHDGYLFLKENSFPLQFEMIYYLIRDRMKEVKVKSFTFFSLNDIIMKDNYYTNFIDIGLYPMGMGHVCVLGFDRESKMFFFRHDGGSNGIEREIYYNKYRNMKPSVEYKDNMISFDKVLELILTLEYYGEMCYHINMIE